MVKMDMIASIRTLRSNSMGVARHPLPAELVGVSLEDIMKRYTARFADRKADWAAFEDAKIEGFRRAQHRFIGAGGSGKHGDTSSTRRRTLRFRSCSCLQARATLLIRTKLRSLLRPPGASRRVRRRRAG